MLVLKRKPHQKVLIGKTIVTVLDVTAHSVRLGIEAPKRVRVLRDELKRFAPKTRSRKAPRPAAR